MMSGIDGRGAMIQLFMCGSRKPYPDYGKKLVFNSQLDFYIVKVVAKRVGQGCFSDGDVMDFFLSF